MRVSIDGDCDMKHTVSTDCIEIKFGRSMGSLQLCLTEDAASKFAHVLTTALDDFRQRRGTAA